MKRNAVLTATSLLAIVLLSLHLADDIAYGTDGSATSVIAIAILVIWLCGTLILAERRSGHIIMLLGSLAGLVVFAVHASRVGGLATGPLALSSGPFFFVWTLLALAVTSVFTAILSVLGLLEEWKQRSSLRS